MTERRPMSPVSGLKPDTLTPPPRRRQPAAPAAVSSPGDAPAQGSAAEVDDELEAAAAAVNADLEKAKQQPRPTRPRLVADPAPTSATDDAVRSLPVSMPPDLDQALRQFARDRGQSQIDTVLDALSIGIGPLTELVEAAKAAKAGASVASDGLFVRTKKAAGTGRVALSLRTRQVNLTAIDNLAEHTGAESRSQLIVAALRAHLRHP